MASVWRDAIVSDAALTTCIRDLRRALGDSSDTPRYIETVHRRGFRFIGPVAEREELDRARRPGRPRRADRRRPRQPGRSRRLRPARTLVGRDAELARLHELLGTAMGRRRQLVFVTGEPGIGKTALVEAFLAQISHRGGPARRSRTVRGAVRRRRGLSAAARGAGAPGPRAARRRDRSRSQAVRADLARAAARAARPTRIWRPCSAALRGRRASGCCESSWKGLDALTVDSPLVLVLEDLHWSDSATIDLLAMLARRREAVALAGPRDLSACRRGRRLSIR